jgi:hypothetical protein
MSATILPLHPSHRLNREARIQNAISGIRGLYSVNELIEALREDPRARGEVATALAYLEESHS